MQPRKLILQSHLALGDVVMLTAAVRDLHRLCPGRFITDVRTAFPDLWVHNPYLKPLDPLDSTVETVGCDTPMVGRSGQVPCHCLYAFMDFLNRRLGVQLEPTEFRGDIHLSEAERSAPSPFRELAGRDAPYWLVCAGGKHDITIKWWAAERYQEVIDHFRGRIQFVQVGHVGHYHPRLDGVMDLRGRTDLRQLLRLVHNADGVLCGVTGLMHLAAAVPRPPQRRGLRPCVVIAGGREPAHWEAYPGHQYLHTVGGLQCCREGGCWKSRTRTLGDGAPQDEPDSRCVDVVGSLPRCMHLITSQAVIGRIESYFDGGVARYLRPRQARLAARAMRAAGPSGFEDLPLTLASARLALEAFLDTAPSPPACYRGRGIVICGGGARYFTNAWVCLNALRRRGCRLPIQLWHLGRREMDPDMERLVAPLQVECVDASRVQRAHPVRHLGFWGLKPYAILFSPFRQVLLLDADNVPVRDPTFLFDIRPLRESGALFWPDFGGSRRADTIWRSCGLDVPAEPEFESGQVLVDKRRCWPALRLALWFNEHSDFYYQHLHGDKDTFSVAFRRLHTAYRLVPHPPEPFPGGMHQHDFEGRRLFQHRTGSKWTLMPHNPRLPGFQFQEECLADLELLRRGWDGRLTWLRAQSSRRPLWRRPRHGPVTVAAWMITCPERDESRRATLASLAASDWPDLPLHVQVDPEKTSDRVQRIGRQVLHALQQFLDDSADYLLLLEDDLRFNRHLRYNVQRWRPYRRREITLAGLYNPGLRELAFDLAGHAVAVAPESAFGTQALLLSRPAVQHVVSAWNTLNAAADLRLVRLAAQLGRPLYYYAPSLVQHQPVPSTWGGATHTAPDFDPDWRA
ncbi:MAG: glycosyltransferase family 9 protein [Verrucomicrobiota bacterium]